VNVGAEPRVVGEIPAFVVGIVVDDDIVAVPVPAVAEGYVIGGYPEVEAAEPEASRAAASQTPVMFGAKAAGEATVFPRVIEMIVRIVAAGVVAYPVIAFVDVGRVGVSLMVVKVAMIFLGMGRAVEFARSVSRWTRRCVLTTARVLCNRGQAGDERHSQNSQICFHGLPPSSSAQFPDTSSRLNRVFGGGARLVGWNTAEECKLPEGGEFSLPLAISGRG
jgi:hypothetical protein